MELDLTQKFELLNGTYAGYTVKSSNTTEAVLDTVELTVRDVLVICMSKLSRVESEIDYLKHYISLYIRLKDTIKDLEVYQAYEQLSDKLKTKKNKLEKPLFTIEDEYEKNIIIDLIDKCVVYPNDSTLDNVVRGYCIWYIQQN